MKLAKPWSKWSHHRGGRHQRANAAVAAGAHLQHSWVMQGDDRGIYGPQGAQFMHFIAAPPPVAATSEPPAVRPRTSPSATRFAS